jgi:hypothetical protein
MLSKITHLVWLDITNIFAATFNRESFGED